MIVTKQQLNAMIQEEIQIVLTEKEIKQFFKNNVLPLIREQKKLLNEQQQELLEEGIKEFFGSIKGFVSKGWEGIKSLFASFMRIVKALPMAAGIATTVSSALGWAITQTPEGQQLVDSTMTAVTKAMETGAEGTQYAQKVLNVGIEMLQYLGMSIDQMDPQAVIEQTNQQLTNLNTAVDMFMAIPSQYFVFFGVAPLAIFVVWKLIKAAWGYFMKSNKKQSVAQGIKDELQDDDAAFRAAMAEQF
tara:strand:+ start:2955 stop:3692 length:738 start_codon:yes stop_codon:yes gene_type:complete